MLFIGRGFVTRAHRRQDDLLSSSRRKEYPLFFALGENNACGFNNQIFVFVIFAVIGAVRARQDPLGLRDLRHRRQRAGGRLCRHPTRWVRMRAYLLSALCATRRRADAGGAGQGRHLAQSGLGPRAHRHRLGDRRRRLDPRRPRPGARLVPRRGPGRADRQGAARGRADHPHRQGRQRQEMQVQAMHALPPGRGAGLPRPHPARWPC